MTLASLLACLQTGRLVLRKNGRCELKICCRRTYLCSPVKVSCTDRTDSLFSLTSTSMARDSRVSRRGAAAAINAACNARNAHAA
mgnify:CR=1 FL=1